MATEVKKRKPQGPRKVKAKVLYIAVKGTVEDFKVMNDAESVLELHEAQPGAYKVIRHTLPMKAPAAPATA